MKRIQLFTFAAGLAVLSSAIAKADSADTPGNSDKPSYSATGATCEASTEDLQECIAVRNNWHTVAILQKLPIPGEKAFVRQDPGNDVPTCLSLFKVIATNSSSVSVGTIIIVETGYDPKFSNPNAGGYYVLDLMTYLPKKIDGDRVAYYWADNATCIGISNDVANYFINKISNTLHQKS